MATTAQQAPPDDLLFVEETYAAATGRAVDPRALRDALARLRGGESRAAFLQALLRADEALEFRQRDSVEAPPPNLKRLLAIGGTDSFVEASFRLVAGRVAAENERADARRSLTGGLARLAWLRQLRSATAGGGRTAALVDVHRLDLTADELRCDGAPSLERLCNVPDEAFVELAYRALLGRRPDPTGRDALLAALAAGDRRTALLAELAASPEGRDRGIVVDGLPPLRSRAARLAHRAWRLLRRHLRRPPATADRSTARLQTKPPPPP